jgi:Cof subfamily protein (haloacid dehalogenase superfamily)
MEYKLICIDMDGTLLNSRKQISSATRAILLKAHQRGVHVVISTGRTYADALYYANMVGIRSPIIAANGAYIHDQEQHQLIYQSLLSEKLALKILDICNQYHVAPSFHTPEKEYYGNIFLILLWYLLRFKNKIQSNDNGVKRKYVMNKMQWRKVITKEQSQILKCIIIDLSQKKINQIRQALAKVPELEVASSGSNNIELNCKGISKGKGVEILAKYYNLKKGEIIAIGDGENDLSMIEYAGLGVAMGNASDVVKQKADYITDTNDNDGVAKVIEKFVLSA